MFPSPSGRAAPHCLELLAPEFERHVCSERLRFEVIDLRRQYATCPRDSPMREHLFETATLPFGKVAAFIEPLLPRDVRGGVLLSAPEMAALRCLVFLPVADIGVDTLLRAGLPLEAAHDLCDLLRDAPDDAIASTLVSAAKALSPLKRWWLGAPGPTADAASRNARRELRVLQLAGYRQWPFEEAVWRGAVTQAGDLLRRDPQSGLPIDPRTGLALLDLLPRNPHSQRLMTTFTGEPILLFSIRRGFPAPAVEKMLSLGFDANVSSPDGRAPAGDAVPILPGASPLHYAALHGDLETIELLARYGADLNARDARGYSPMLYARAGAPLLYGSDSVIAVGPADRADARLRDDTAAIVCAFYRLGADPQVCGYDGASVLRTLVLSVMASRDGGGMTDWPEFERLIVMLHEMGVHFDMPGGGGVQQIEAFAQINARGNPNDAIWAVHTLLDKLQS